VFLKAKRAHRTADDRPYWHQIDQNTYWAFASTNIIGCHSSIISILWHGFLPFCCCYLSKLWSISPIFWIYFF